MDNRCQCCSDRVLNPILFKILSQLDDSSDYNSIPHRCTCELRRTVCLKRPTEICKEASSVLVKTVHFMKNLPAFKQLPPNDQFILLKNCWVPLFILGLAQEHVDFEVEDVPADSMLKKILLRREGGNEIVKEQPTMAGVSKLKSCLRKFWSLDLSPKEYAYLKGTTIFNPDIPDLKASLFIEGLQQEAQHALSEVVQLLHPRRQERFARILLTASMLQSITPSLIIELLFRPVIGQADLLELLVDMLFCR
ncbi:nuclear receptor subfamily 0 group B member 2a [Syngnathus acus]|uniref:nuclear receptor subfamily 0 group B member 2a n=1 Tax=Syngnathus acus TaxID=161584 RepID=UPI001885E306|nr:nuclear receptor subfamily 0 group B member 2a [Syngnathus acus]XP_049587304.1 nuclear receptor subfamily 0 group B member 2a [Syngnathus scovelli]